LRGLIAIHGCNVLNLDVKAGNVLLTSVTREVRLCDFGVSMDLTNLDPETKIHNTGSPGSQAPELLQKEGARPNTAMDVWSAGIVWYQMLLGRPPCNCLEVSGAWYRTCHLPQILAPTCLHMRVTFSHAASIV
jgi:serine/threonine protein kinase